MIKFLIDFFSTKPKLKFQVAFSEVIEKEADAIQILHGYKVIKSDRLGKYTWKITMRSNKTSDDIITDLSKRKKIRDVTSTSD